MALQAQSPPNLNELTPGETGWPLFQHYMPGDSSSTEIHLSEFLSPEVSSFGSFSPFEIPTLPAFISHGTLEPFQCIGHNFPWQSGDPQSHGLSYDSGYDTVLPSPASGRFYDRGSAASDSHSALDSPSISGPLQNAIAAMQGSHDITDIGTTICSLVAEYLKRLGGLSTVQATTTPLPARNNPLPPPDTKTSGRILVDSQVHKPSNRSRKTRKVANSGLVEHAKDRVVRSRKGRRGDFTCSHPGCTTKALSSRRNLLRHQENVHSIPVVLACGAVQKYRRDNFVRHRRNCQTCQESSS